MSSVRGGIATVVIGATLGAAALIASSAGADGESSRLAPSCRGERATIAGSNGDDTLRGTSRADVIVGRAGGDAIDGRGGGDLICAGNDSDFVDGGGAKDRLYGEGGDDILIGDESSDKLYGNNGDDAMDGQDGKMDLCIGSSGADLASGAGCERIRGATET